MPLSIDVDASSKHLVHLGHCDHTKAAYHSVKMAEKEKEDRNEPKCDITATVDSS